MCIQPLCFMKIHYAVEFLNIFSCAKNNEGDLIFANVPLIFSLFSKWLMPFILVYWNCSSLFSVTFLYRCFHLLLSQDKKKNRSFLFFSLLFWGRSMKVLKFEIPPALHSRKCSRWRFFPIISCTLKFIARFFFANFVLLFVRIVLSEWSLCGFCSFISSDSLIAAKINCICLKQRELWQYIIQH